MNTPLQLNETFCGNVPLNLTNLIQPHGYLLIIERSSLRILQVSENVHELTNRSPAEMISMTLHDCITSTDIEEFEDRMGKSSTDQMPFLFSFDNGKKVCRVREQEDYYFFEIENELFHTETPKPTLDIYREMRSLMAALDSTDTLREACDIAVAELKRISGFDKIMIYRFDEQWNGDVIAETLEEGMDSYLGLKFPASDIPRQARDLYRIMPYRLIPDTAYKPVKLYPVVNPLTHSFTDLTYSNLRSVSGVHLEYLRNMQVMASMSTRILQNNNLWGLIACHHRTPKCIPFEICALFELFSASLSARISTILLKEKLLFRGHKLQLLQSITASLYKNYPVVTPDEDWLKLLGAEGIAFADGMDISVTGKTPDRHSIEYLLLWIQSLGIENLYIHENLPAVYQPAEQFSDSASGLMVLSVNPEKNMYILVFRPEEIQQVNWAGKPDEAVHFEADGKKYHPRASFRIWQQNLKNTSKPWSAAEKEVAEEFRKTLAGLEWLQASQLS